MTICSAPRAPYATRRADCSAPPFPPPPPLPTPLHVHPSRPLPLPLPPQVLVFATADNSEVGSFSFKSGVNAVLFCGRGDFCSLIVGTFAGYINSLFSSTRVKQSDSPPPDASQLGLKFGTGQFVHCMTKARDGTRLAVGGKGGLVSLYNVELTKGRACDLELLASFNATGDVFGVAMDENASIVVTGGDQKLVQIWRPYESGPDDEVSVCPSNCFSCKSKIHSIALTANGHHLAVGTSESVEVYKLAFSANTFSSLSHLGKSGSGDMGTMRRLAMAPRMVGRLGLRRTPNRRKRRVKQENGVITQEQSTEKAQGLELIAECSWPRMQSSDSAMDLPTPPPSPPDLVTPALSRPDAADPTGRNESEISSCSYKRCRSSRSLLSNLLDTKTEAFRRKERELNTFYPALFRRRTTIQFRPSNPCSRNIFSFLARAMKEDPDDQDPHYVTIEPVLLIDSHAHQGGVAFAGEALSLLAIAGGFNVNVTSLATGGSLYSLKRSGRVRCVALSKEGGLLLVGGFDHIVSLHVLGRGAVSSSYDLDNGRSNEPEFSPKHCKSILAITRTLRSKRNTRYTSNDSVRARFEWGSICTPQQRDEWGKSFLFP